MTPQEWKENRLKLGLSQSQLALKLNVRGKQYYICKIENGKCNPSYFLTENFKQLIKENDYK